jgi:hypothetical protein
MLQMCVCMSSCAADEHTERLQMRGNDPALGGQASKTQAMRMLARKAHILHTSTPLCDRRTKKEEKGIKNGDGYSTESTFERLI